MNTNKIKDFQKTQNNSPQLHKFLETFNKKKANIQKKYKKSITNKLYIFPRQQSQSSSLSSSDQQIDTLYTLKHQNRKNKKNQSNLYLPQTKKPNFIKNLIQYNSTKSAKSLIQTSGRKTLKPTKAHKNIQISFDTKKKTKKNTSSSKLLVQQYSLDNRIVMKKSSRGVVVSFRGSKNKDINVCMSGKKVKTEVF